MDTTELLDFSGIDFTKSLSLNATKQQNTEIETKHNSVKLGEYCNIIRGVTYSKSDESINETKNIILTADNISLEGNLEIKKQVFLKNSLELEESKKLIKEDVFMCFASGSLKHLGKVAFIKEDTNYFAGGFMGIIRVKQFSISIIIPKFLYEILNNKQFRDKIRAQGTGANIKNLSNSLANIKIPLPDKPIQEQIISECEDIDQESQSAQQTITQAKAEIESKVTQEQKQNITLDSLLYRNSETIDPNSENGAIYYIGLENIESNTGEVIGKTNFDYSEIKSNKTIFIKDDILYGKLRPNLNKVLLADQDGICSTDILVLRSKNYKLRKFYKYHLMSKMFNKKVLNTVSGQQLPRTSWDKIKNFTIPVPSLEEQNQLITEVELLENKIARAHQTIAQAPQQKQKVLVKHLQ